MPIQRRELLIGAGAALATATAGQALAAEPQGHGDHGDHAAHRKQVSGETPQTPTTIVFENAIALRALGEMCLAFCLDNIPEDPSLVDCARTTKEMLAVNGAVEGLAAMDSPRMGNVARAAIAVYDHCETVCRKHEGHHKICRQCAEQCTAMKKAIAALA